MTEILGHAFFDHNKGNLREHFAVDRVRELLGDRSSGSRLCRRIMVSYCWADTNFVLSKLCMELAMVVDDLWLDRLGGDKGMGEWTRASMEAGVRGADIIVAVVSPNYVKSKNCGFEMELAAKYNRTIIPLMFGVNFSDWPPTKIGQTTMDTQFKDPESGDVKLFVDFTDPSSFDTKFAKELMPRLEKGDPVDYIRTLLADRPKGSTRPCSKVMVSYCWADTDFVLNYLCPELSRVVESLWLDRLGGDQGMGEWTRASMDAGIAGADVIVAVISPGYIKSKNCGFEMELASAHNKVIIPLMFGVPFSDWPPTRIGEAAMSNQFKDTLTGDMKLFVDCTDTSGFVGKFQGELLPRLTKGASRGAAVGSTGSVIESLAERTVATDVSDFKLGAHVSHASRGKGVVDKVGTENGQLKVHIRFDSGTTHGYDRVSLSTGKFSLLLGKATSPLSSNTGPKAAKGATGSKKSATSKKGAVSQKAAGPTKGGSSKKVAGLKKKASTLTKIPAGLDGEGSYLDANAEGKAAGGFGFGFTDPKLSSSAKLKAAKGATASTKVAGSKKKASAPTKLSAAADGGGGYLDINAEKEDAEVFGFGSTPEVLL